MANTEIKRKAIPKQIRLKVYENKKYNLVMESKKSVLFYFEKII